MTNRRITVCVPCFGRPQRTKRIAECLANQNIDNYEMFFIGDHCNAFESLISDGFWDRLGEFTRSRNVDLFAYNLANHFGGYGYAIRNKMKRLASGEYLCFVDNDDYVSANHLQHYLSEIENTDYDFVYYNTFDNSRGIIRNVEPAMGLIGHAELCIRTDFFATLPDQSAHYGHDWEMIQDMLNKGKHKKAESPNYTYKIMGTPYNREQYID